MIKITDKKKDFLEISGGDIMDFLKGKFHIVKYCIISNTFHIFRNLPHLQQKIPIKIMYELNLEIYIFLEKLHKKLILKKKHEILVIFFFIPDVYLLFIIILFKAIAF